MPCWRAAFDTARIFLDSNPFNIWMLRAARQSVGSADVNSYVREATGQGFTAKDFRTWAGTVRAARGRLGQG